MEHLDFKFYGFLFIGLYLAVLIFTGLWYGRKEAGQDFIIGNRNIGIVPTAASLAASFRDGGGIAFWVTAGFAASYGGLWLFVGIFFSIVIITLIGPRLRQEAKITGIITVQERVQAYVGPVSAKLSAVVSLIFCLLVISMQYHVTGNIFAQILDVPAYVGVALVCAILVLYLVTGGYKSVIVTDTIQFFVMFSLLVIPFIIPPSAADMTNFKSFLEPSLSDKIAFTLYGVYFLLIAPECWQRVFSARDDRTVRLGIPLTYVMLVIMTLSLIWLGMGVKLALPDIDAKASYIQMFQNTDAIEPWVLGYLLIVFLSITMSTQSAACYSFTSTLNKIFFKEKTETDKSYIHFSRIAITISLIFSGVLSLAIHDVIKYLFDIVGFIICLAPIYIYAIVANRMEGPQSLPTQSRAALDKVITGVTVAGILIFIAVILLGLSGKGFIFSMLPGVITTFAVAGAIAVFIKGDRDHKRTVAV